MFSVGGKSIRISKTEETDCSLRSFEGLEAEVVIVFDIGKVSLIGKELPVLHPVFWEIGIAFDVGVDAREINPICQLETTPKNLFTTDQKNFAAGSRATQGFFEGRRHLRTDGLKIRIATYDDRLTIGKRTPDRCPRLAAHDHAVPRRERFEMLKIRRQTPRQAVVVANHIVFRNGRDDRNSHTETRAAIAGAGS